MSSQGGRVRVFVLAELDEVALSDSRGLWLHAITIATRLFGPEPRPGQLESVRRVLRELVAEGVVEVRREGVSAYEAADWASVQAQRRHSRLVARIPLAQRERAVARQAERPLRDPRL